MNEPQQLNTADQNFYKINREHKDCLFRLTFREKHADAWIPVSRQKL